MRVCDDLTRRLYISGLEENLVFICTLFDNPTSMTEFYRTYRVQFSTPPTHRANMMIQKLQMQDPTVPSQRDAEGPSLYFDRDWRLDW